jgi:hypothetical protein
MRLASLLLSLALVAAPAVAETGVPEIRIVGEAPPAPAEPSPAAVKAVERFLSLRQEASVVRAKSSSVRRVMASGPQVNDETLVGPRGATLAAFDFKDADLPAARSRATRFDVPARVLFAGADGQVVESRTEALTFVASGGGWACSKIVPTNVITWDSMEALERASGTGIAGEIGRLKAFLTGAATKKRTVVYSVANVGRGANGTVVVQCLRYTAETGRRGFDVSDAPVVLSKQNGAYRIESN